MVYTSIAGIGFDAHVAHKFSDSHIRGMISYMRIILNEFKAYKPLIYKLSIDGKEVEKEALMIVFANGNQFGFNTRIAPKAKVDDGLIDVCVFRKMPVSQLFNVGIHMLRGTTVKTGYAEYFRGKNITIHNQEETMMNIDGEPRVLQPPLEINIRPLSLKVIVP